MWDSTFVTLIDTMRLIQNIFNVCILLQVIQSAMSMSSFNTGYEFHDDLMQLKHIHSDPELRSVEHMVMREMADDDPDALSDDEERVRVALMRSMQDTRNRRTISEMMTVLRSLSEKQRLALATLIAMQTNTKSSISMDSPQVGKDNYSSM